MWHQEILDHELEKLIKQIVICQKVVRGFLCRKHLKFYSRELNFKQNSDNSILLLPPLSSLTRTTEALDATALFLNQIENNCSQTFEKMSNLKSDVYKVNFNYFNFLN